ncbi:SRPBCC family protein [uncultured Proteiniphilum sp.]|uniref:SRPBCC family protein n=1 Tax=uncultured Proteiniphilum sp. TaxID=497637 RepID=UPI00260A036F|nr:SRPBCC family protein [uncultured Proteiniphilum sp.]
MTETKIPTVETQMLIRKPVATVFQAFIDPTITTNFWFTKSSGQLEVGKTTTWEWEMYGVSTKVFVKDIIPNKKISIEWDDTPVTTVDFEFTALTDDTTYVVIKNYGFKETGDDLIQAIQDNTGGFTTVLDGMKAYLEYNLKLNLIGDKFPKEISNHGQ